MQHPALPLYGWRARSRRQAADRNDENVPAVRSVERYARDPGGVLIVSDRDGRSRAQLRQDAAHPRDLCVQGRDATFLRLVVDVARDATERAGVQRRRRFRQPGHVSAVIEDRRVQEGW